MISLSRASCQGFLKQWVPTDPAEFEMINKKVYKVRSRRYISGGTLLILIYFVYVLKGKYDIMLVYDLTPLVLSDAFWDPTFGVLSVDNFLDVATH